MKTESIENGDGHRPPLQENDIDSYYNELLEPMHYDFGLSRRTFTKILGTGLLLVISAPALAQRRGGGGGFLGRGAKNIAARLHIGTDGVITLLVGKVEAGQGSRAEFTQAAAEELRVPASQMVLAAVDTSLVPDDGMTAGSGSTPRTVPAIRQAAAAVREMLIDFAAKQWGTARDGVTVKDGKAMDSAGKRSLGYADFAKSDEAAKDFVQAVSGDVALTATKEWTVMGTSLIRPNARDVVTGEHQYPSDISRPGMHYGKVLRPPSYGAKLTSVDVSAVKAMNGVIVAQSEGFVGVTASTSFAAQNALDAIAKTAKWETASQVSSKELFGYLKQHAEGGVPANPFADELPKAVKVLRASYDVAYAQHSPLEPRAAVAEWTGNDSLTVWTGTQNPFGVRAELARAFHLPEEKVRVIVPDFGAAFGGKHTGETAVEAARLAQAAGKPVSLRWTREEEFTWAYFRPAAAIEIEASLDANGKVTSWHFININSGNAALDTPYNIANHRSQYVQSQPPLRHGSYRGLAATANNFARECFMDELATAAGADPLEFRMAHLDNPRLRAVLETAAEKFGWKDRVKFAGSPAIGIACGVEKGGYVAACVEIEMLSKNQIRVKHVCEAFECGAIVNPGNLTKQVQGAVIMGLGPALREEVRFENGENQTISFRSYPVPRYEDVPELDVQLIDRPDLPSAGAGETPIMCIAPAIANAVFRATGKRVRTMPVRV